MHHRTRGGLLAVAASTLILTMPGCTSAAEEQQKIKESTRRWAERHGLQKNPCAEPDPFDAKEVAKARRCEAKWRSAR